VAYSPTGFQRADPIVSLLIAGLTGRNHPPSNPAPGVPSGHEIPLVTAKAFDPSGDQQEHSADAPNAVDDNPSTVWATETYQVSATLAASANKPGVGLIVDAGKPVSARTMEVTSVARGWKADIYGSASSAAPATLEGWGAPISQLDDFSTDQTLQLQDTAPSRFFLIWITRLSPEATQSPEGGIGGYNLQIKDVKLFS